MCFYKESDFSEHAVSGEDTICFKVVRIVAGQYYSTVLGFRYCVGETYTDDSMPLSVLDSLYKLEGGVFHSYMTMYRGYVGNLVALNQITLYHRVILKCVIPAGTPYWKSDDENEYASMSIKILEAIDPVDFIKNYDTFVN